MLQNDISGCWGHLRRAKTKKIVRRFFGYLPYFEIDPIKPTSKFIEGLNISFVIFEGTMTMTLSSPGPKLLNEIWFTSKINQE